MQPLQFSLKSWLWLLLLLPLTFAARSQNHSNVFVSGKIYFIDADCYSRMTRVQQVIEHPFKPVRHHDFENYPQGTRPHTTAPMDYLIAFLALILKPFTSQPVDLAGALVSPILGCATLCFLWLWGNRLPYAAPMLILFAISPILVHGTILGRPDHQSLLIFLLAMAIGSEWTLSRLDSVRWQIISGLAWGTSLWVSFYEPLLLLIAMGAAHAFFSRKSLFHADRWYWVAAFSVPLLLMLVVDRIPFDLPNRVAVHAFSSWKSTIGELASISPFSPLLFQWTGLFLFASPILLVRKQRALLFLLACVYALSLWQIRWGYYLALVFVMTLPWQLESLQKRWVIWTLFIISLWPLLREWDQRLFPDETRSERLTYERYEAQLLRKTALQLRSPEITPILAPWWLCPSISYWSGQPAIAGSSHESLPGIIDTARFYLSEEPQEALKILQERGVKLVLVCEPSRVIETSQPLVPNPSSEKALAVGLYQHPHTTPGFLRFRGANQLFKLFLVEE